MEYFQKEEVFDCFQSVFFGLESGLLNNTQVSGITICRDEDLDLRIELTSAGWVQERSPPRQAGEVYTSTEELRFEHVGGWKSVARGLVYHGVRSSAGVDEASQSVETYTAHSVEVDCGRAEPPAHTIEWVGNLPDHWIWPSHTSREENTSYSHRIGVGSAAITMTRTGWGGGGSPTLHVHVDGIDLYLLRRETRDKTRNSGRIIYKGCYPEETRKRIRLCLSFALGLPIVYYGHTDYCAAWLPTFMKAYDAMSIDGAMFKLHDLPPYPFSDSRIANMIDEAALNQIVDSLYAKYDELRFNELSWAYWYAVCAPLHTAAVHFGGLIEKLQKSLAVPFKADRKGLLTEDSWRELQAMIQAKLASMDMPDEVRPVLKSKVASLNQLPQNIALKRLLDKLGMELGKAELGAWRHRNMAAHGDASEEVVSIILNAKLLKLLFHRLLAGITYCSERYVDYYSLDFPVRAIEKAVPLKTTVSTP